jgi:hypothetical protein
MKPKKNINFKKIKVKKIVIKRMRFKFEKKKNRRMKKTKKIKKDEIFISITITNNASFQVTHAMSPGSQILVFLSAVRIVSTTS